MATREPNGGKGGESGKGRRQPPRPLRSFMMRMTPEDLRAFDVAISDTQRGSRAGDVKGADVQHALTPAREMWQRAERELFELDRLTRRLHEITDGSALASGWMGARRNRQDVARLYTNWLVDCRQAEQTTEPKQNTPPAPYPAYSQTGGTVQPEIESSSTRSVVRARRVIFCNP